MKGDKKANELSEAAPESKKTEAADEAENGEAGAKNTEPAAKAEKAEPAPGAEKFDHKPNKKITMYLRFSNVKSLDSRCQVELQVWLSLQCDWAMSENA